MLSIWISTDLIQAIASQARNALVVEILLRGGILEIADCLIAALVPRKNKRVRDAVGIIYTRLHARRGIVPVQKKAEIVGTIAIRIGVHTCAR